MAGVYRPHHPERTVLYRILFHYFDQFLAEYESHFEKEYGFLRPIIKKVVERYLDCGNPRCGFARVRCPDCGSEFLLHFSCRSRGFCPSCHAKRLEEWGEWIREELLLDVPHRQVVFTIPRMLRIFFKYKRRLISFSVYKGNKIRDSLISNGFLKSYDISTFEGRVNYLELTEIGGKALREMGYEITRKREVGPKHEYWKHRVAELFRGKGFRWKLKSRLERERLLIL